MKNTLTAITTGLLLSLASAFSAQAQTTDWHLDIAAGLNLFQGEDDASMGLYAHRYTISPVITVGNWITPSLGIQANLWGGELKGLSFGQSPYSIKPNPDLQVNFHDALKDPWEERFNYGMAQIEGTLNVSNALMGYYPERVWSIIMHGGIEYAYSFNDNCHSHSIGGVAGITSNWKLFERLSLFLDGTLTVFGKDFDLVTYRDNIDDMLTVRAGMVINLGHKLKVTKKLSATEAYQQARMHDAASRENAKR